MPNSLPDVLISPHSGGGHPGYRLTAKPPGWWGRHHCAPAAEADAGALDLPVVAPAGGVSTRAAWPPCDQSERRKIPGWLCFIRLPAASTLNPHHVSLYATAIRLPVAPMWCGVPPGNTANGFDPRALRPPTPPTAPNAAVTATVPPPRWPGNWSPTTFARPGGASGPFDCWWPPAEQVGLPSGRSGQAGRRTGRSWQPPRGPLLARRRATVWPGGRAWPCRRHRWRWCFR